LETTKAGFNFYIDAGEVTRKAFAVWMATNPAPANPNPECAGVTLGASESCMQKPEVCQGDGCDNHPQVCVSWCDADAYCQWAGKRLCGKHAGGENEWQIACWGDYTSSYPYGEQYPYGQGYEAGHCNGSDTGLGTTVPTRSLSSCRGAFPDLYDLSGNVAEWADGLEPKQYWGGSFASPGSQMHCSSHFGKASGEASEKIGFRCCSD